MFTPLVWPAPFAALLSRFLDFRRLDSRARLAVNARAKQATRATGPPAFPRAMCRLLALIGIIRAQVIADTARRRFAVEDRQVQTARYALRKHDVGHRPAAQRRAL